MSKLDADKIFIPTLECMLQGGTESITSFADKPKKGDKEHKHLVVITKDNIDNLTEAERGTLGTARQVSQSDFRLRSKRAQEILRFLNTQLQEGFGLDKQYDLGDNLYVVLSSKNSIKDLKESTPHEKTSVICRYEGERIQFSRIKMRNELALFTRVDPNIRREGMVNIEHDELYNELMEFTCQRGSSRVISTSTVDDFVENIYPNQYLIFNRSTEDAEPLIGFVAGDVNWKEEHGQKTRFLMDDLQINLMLVSDLMGNNAFDVGRNKGLKPRNLEQAIYMHALHQEHIGLVFVTGGAGTGKTIVGYGSALAQTIQKQSRGYSANTRDNYEGSDTCRFRDIYVVKSFSQIGDERTNLGFTKGTDRQKLVASVQSYVDAHNALHLGISFTELEYEDPALFEEHSKQQKKASTKKNTGKSNFIIPEKGVIHVENYGKWRGRTIENSCVFVDEAQNLTPDEMIHLIQRMGFGGQYIIGGDYESQIDDANMNATNNGLFLGIKHFIDQPYSAVISLEKSQRHMAAAHAYKMPTF